MPNQTTNSQTKRKQLAIPVANKTTKLDQKYNVIIKVVTEDGLIQEPKINII